MPHDQMVYVKETTPGEVAWRVFRPTPPNTTEWSKHISERYKRRTEQNWFISNKRMSLELMYSPEYTRNQLAAGTILLLSAGTALKAKVRNTHSGAVDNVGGRMGHARTNWTECMTHTPGKICPLATYGTVYTASVFLRRHLPSLGDVHLWFLV